MDDSEPELAGLSFVDGTLWTDGRHAGADAPPPTETGEQISVLLGRDKRLITNADKAAVHGRTQWRHRSGDGPAS